MEIDIPSNYYSFQLNITIKTDELSRIRIVALDPNKPATKYLDRVAKLMGKRTFELKFPVSPKKLKIVIYNMANGNLPYGEDASFSIEDMKVEKLPLYDVWWNKDTQNFYNFAVEFSQNASILSAGENKPHIYRSDDGKFTIDYYNNIIDRKTNKLLSTPARIGHNTGIIEVSKNKFLQYTIPMRLIILLHEFAHKHLNPKIDRPISYETGADIQGLYVYLGKGWSPYEAHKTFLQVFRNAKNEPNHKRYKIINDFISRYEKGLVSEQKK